MIRSRIALLPGALALTGFTGDADDASARQPQSAGAGHLNLVECDAQPQTGGEPLIYVLNRPRADVLGRR
jgi:hypothetical protein